MVSPQGSPGLGALLGAPASSLLGPLVSSTISQAEGSSAEQTILNEAYFQRLLLQDQLQWKSQLSNAQEMHVFLKLGRTSSKKVLSL